MRTYSEIHVDVYAAMATGDAQALRQMADELVLLDTQEALGLAFSARGAAAGMSGLASEAKEWISQSLEISEALNDRSGVAACEIGLGNVNKMLGDYRQAIERYRRARAIYIDLSDESGTALVDSNIGILLDMLGSHEEAIISFRTALDAYSRLKDKAGIARTSSNLGRLHLGIGQWTEALVLFHKSAQLAEEIGSRGMLATNVNDIGKVHFNTGAFPEALEYFHRSLSINEEIGRLSEVAYTTSNIGALHAITGSHKTALDFFRRALDLQSRINNATGVAEATINIGTLYTALEEYDAAQEHLERALSYFETIGNLPKVASIIASIGRNLWRSGQIDALRTLMERFCKIELSAPDLRVIRDQLTAEILMHDGDLEGAAKALKAGLHDAMEHGLRSSTATTHRSLRELAKKRNDLAAYIEHNDEYVKINEELQGKGATQKIAMQEAERQMTVERVERDKERAVLYSALPKHIADRVIHGEQVNDHFEQAAVLFMDIVGFTTMSSVLASSEVVRILDAVFDTCDRICAHHDVLKIKTIGDSYMAAALPDRPHSIQRIASAALEILQAVQQIELPIVVGVPPRLTVRIGLHAGPVTAGVLGRDRVQYDIWGDTVNVASRMESSGEPGRIHVSAAFAHTDQNDHVGITFIPRGFIEIKGKGPMDTFWLERTKQQTD